VTTLAVASSEPEQLPLLRMLEIVRDRVESIHAGQRSMTAEIREIKANLPQQRKPLSPRTFTVVRADEEERCGRICLV
jgi:hypothetical protein